MKTPAEQQPGRRTFSPGIEPLEDRVAPAAVLVNATTVTYQDGDGDKVTVHVTKGTLDLAQNFAFIPSGAGEQLKQLTLANMREFQGAKVTITSAKVGGGDGHVDVGYINASGIDLAGISVDGDLGRVDAGDTIAKTPALGFLQTQSIGAEGLATQGGAGTLISNIQGKLGRLQVAHDIVLATIDVTGSIFGGIGNISVGGGLLGGNTADSGSISAEGNIGPVKITTGIIGSSGLGGINAARLHSGGSITSVVTGALLGGGDDGSGVIQAERNIGPVRITHNVIGGSGDDSGSISTVAGGNIASVTIGGLLAGGDGTNSGKILTDGGGDIGAVRIGHSGGTSPIAGGSGAGSGAIQTNGGNIASVTVFGSLAGGGAADTGSIRVHGSGNIGAVKIFGPMVGGAGDRSGSIRVDDNGSIASVKVTGPVAGSGGAASGSIITHEVGNIGPVVIGSLNGGSDSDAGSIIALRGSVASVNIGDDMHGGSGTRSGSIVAGLKIGPVALDRLFGGTNMQTGSIVSLHGDISSVKVRDSILGVTASVSESAMIEAPAGTIGSVHIAQDLVGGNTPPIGVASKTGGILAANIGNVLIGRHLVSGVNNGIVLTETGSIEALQHLGSVTVMGNVISAGGLPVRISARGQESPGGGKDVAIGSVHVHGNADHLEILAGYSGATAANPDAQIGTVRVDGNWSHGDIAAGVDAVDGFFGNPNDIKIALPALDTGIVARIGKIIIGGTVTGSPVLFDGFGFVAEQIGSVKVQGVPVLLTPGPANDLTPISVPSSTNDVYVLEVS